MSVLSAVARVAGILAGLLLLVGGGGCAFIDFQWALAPSPGAPRLISVLLGLVALAVAAGGVRLIIEMVRQMSSKPDA